ncbi:MAG: aldolase/citrate lyase family protein [Bacteroidales bacterium]|jgi:citrate lyase subunit beta/citryl-CoA lyase|nr:aldolase/citrate lyase family protein [Bacteroidales bacterium]
MVSEKIKTAYAGNKGTGVRSDCFIELELTNSGGIQFEMNSKVEVMFGKSNKKLVLDILGFFNIEHAHIQFVDSGALPFVIAARLEAAIKVLIDTEKGFLIEIQKENKLPSKKEQHRFSRLYLPGNSPSLMLNAGIHKPNGLILDLEDAVAPDKKHDARFLVRNALRSLNFYGAERMVRINQGERGLEDLDYVVPHGVNLILVPKVETPELLIVVDEKIKQLKAKYNLKNMVWLMPIIESAKGVMNAYSIATAADSISSLAIGLEDYTADLGVRRTAEATESFFARTTLVNAAVAAGIQAIDSVFSDVSDMEGLEQNVQVSKSLGFNGMGCIHPRQIRVIHDNFAPDKIEIDKAKRIYLAFLNAKSKGLGVVSLGTKMIDAPVVKRAEKVIQLAVDMGKLNKDWQEETKN